MEFYEGMTLEEYNNKQIRGSEIRRRLDELSNDFVQAFAGAYIPDLDERKKEFAELHNELRLLLGKPNRIYF